MDKQDLTALVLKHDAAIVTLERSCAQMVLLWRMVGALVLVAAGAFLTAIFSGVLV